MKNKGKGNNEKQEKSFQKKSDCNMSIWELGV